MGTDKPLISVVVPVYKTEAYLRQCVDSLLIQTYSHLEIILVDDGSPDGSGAVCDQYARRDARICVIHQKNGGVSAARNAGVQVATGQYIAFVDSDDWGEPDYVKTLFQAAERCAADAVVEIKGSQTDIWTGEEALWQMCYQKLYDTAPWGKLFRTKIVKEVPFPENMFFEDLAVVCQMIGAARSVAAQSGSRYHYRRNPEGTMNGGNMIRLLDEIKAADMMYTYAKSLPGNESRAAENRKFSAYAQVLMKLPRSGYEAERTRLWKYLCAVRGIVLTDHHARVKNRFAALTSYCGERFMRALWVTMEKIHAARGIGEMKS